MNYKNYAAWQSGIAGVILLVILVFMPTRAQAQEPGFIIDNEKHTVTLENVSQDITAVMQEAVSRAAVEAKAAKQAYTINIPAGKYELTDSILLTGNLKISCKEGTQIAAADQMEQPLIRTDSFEKLEIKGGEWIGCGTGSALMDFRSGSELSLDSVELSGCDSCLISCSSVKNIKVQKSLFIGKRNASQATGIRSDEQTITVEDCTFEHLKQGVSCDTADEKITSHKAQISRNTFYNLEDTVLLLRAYGTIEISDNYMIGGQRGIVIDTASKSKDTKKEIGISGNQILVDYRKNENNCGAVFLEGASKTILSGVTVRDNTITTAGYGIHALYTKNAVLSGNKIAQSGVSMADKRRFLYDGIFEGEGCVNFDITSNTISGMKRHGISLQDKATAKQIFDNSILNCEQNAILLTGKAAVTTYIRQNVIQNIGLNAILLSEGSATANIAYNNIKGVGSAAVMVCGGSTVSGYIRYNTIDSVSLYGNAVAVTTNSTVGKTIANNTIGKNTTGTYACGNGILISNGVNAVGDITGNTIYKARYAGISLLQNCSTGAVTKNTVFTTGTYGIYLYDRVQTKEISANKLTSIGTVPIFLQPLTVGYTITVADNTIAGNIYYVGLRVRSGSVLIKGNSFSECLRPMRIDRGVKGTIENTNAYASSNESTKLVIYTSASNSIAKAARSVIAKLQSKAKNKMIVQWKKQSGVTGYEIQISTKSNFSTVYKTVTVKKAETVKKTLSGLQSKKTYYVRIRAYKTYEKVKVYGDYSNVSKIKVK